jgi:hypothetical protein
MSRTYNEHHPSSHSKKNRVPVPYLEDGVPRGKRKMKPYGVKSSDEKYYKKWGEIKGDVINKSLARRWDDDEDYY